MFNKEELEFIQTMLEDELSSINRKRYVLIKDKKDVDFYNNFISLRENYIKDLLSKIKEIK